MKRLKSVISQLKALDLMTAKIVTSKKLQFKWMPNVDIGWHKLWIQLYIDEAKLREVAILKPLMIEITLALLED